MEIAGMMVVGPHEPYLKEVLDQNFKRLGITNVTIACNNADDATKRLIESFGFKWYDDNREWGKFQPKIKSDLLKRIDADWVVACDADEIIDEDCTRAELEKLAEEGVAWNFYVVNLWNDEDHYAKGLSFWNVRFFKITPEYGLDFVNKPVHCGLAPPFQYRFANDSPFVLWHYGLMDPEKRKKKEERYNTYDPNAVYKSDHYYQALTDDTPPPPLNREEMRARVREDVKNRKMKVVHAAEDPTGYVIMAKDGRTIDVPAKDQRRYERQGWTLKEEVNVNRPQKMYADAPTTSDDAREESKEVEGLECSICGKVCKTDGGLRLHKLNGHGVK